MNYKPASVEPLLSDEQRAFITAFPLDGGEIRRGQPLPQLWVDVKQTGNPMQGAWLGSSSLDRTGEGTFIYTPLAKKLRVMLDPDMPVDEVRRVAVEC